MFNINRQALEKELALIQGAVERKNTIPVLAYCLFEVAQGQAKITGTDLDVTISTSVAVDHDVDWEGCLPAKHLYDLVRLFVGEEVLFTVEQGDRVKVHCGRAQHLLPRRDRKDFPQLDKPAKSSVIILPASTLREMINATLFAISSNSNEGRSHCLSLHLQASDGQLELTGTDTTQLSNVSHKLETKTAFDCLVPRRAALSLLSFLDGEENVQIHVSANHALFVCGERRLLSRLMEGQFPNWKVIIPASGEHKIRISSPDLNIALRRAMLVTEREYAKLVFTIKQGLLTISSPDTVEGQASEPLSIDSPTLNGKEHVIRLNGRQILAFLGAAKTDELFFEFWETVGPPVRLTPATDGATLQYFTNPFSK